MSSFMATFSPPFFAGGPYNDLLYVPGPISTSYESPFPPSSDFWKKKEGAFFLFNVIGVFFRSNKKTNPPHNAAVPRPCDLQ